MQPSVEGGGSPVGNDSDREDTALGMKLVIGIPDPEMTVQQVRVSSHRTPGDCHRVRIELEDTGTELRYTSFICAFGPKG